MTQVLDPFLGPDDPDPVYRVDGGRDWLVTVDHAGRAIPAGLGDLGLPPGAIDRHIGWDIGALRLAEALARRLDARLVAQRYSRLVIDSNRPWASPDLIPQVSDGVAVPGNRGLADRARRRRWDAIHTPYQQALGHAVADGVKALLAVHSYEKRRQVDTASRPWPVGLLARRDNPLAASLRERLAQMPVLCPVGWNQPYGIDDDSDYALPVHAEPIELPHVLIEIRNDFLDTQPAIDRMADSLAAACSGFLESD